MGQCLGSAAPPPVTPRESQSNDGDGGKPYVEKGPTQYSTSEYNNTTKKKKKKSEINPTISSTTAKEAEVQEKAANDNVTKVPGTNTDPSPEVEATGMKTETEKQENQGMYVFVCVKLKAIANALCE
ncbi:hypothetical protein RFI_37793 [Reticulomyxa filosa]|uniref:Uncharacterized protein n=1 Tax=Reticulomyxa filosa TaxID=46433 RepID=X6LDP8_RETFI|nr:hypothetical protein RFI_37793 [Reticulomyxa filosa]|eukprot:ETN99678.1 hypothetical protein RFI_37793 [Reticulomyxa filosa]